jgi:hypothetical protein
MTLPAVERIADALLYEGYMLYPYRPTAVKNRQRFNFGVLPPAGYVAAQPGNERSWMQTECLVRGTSETLVEVRLRCLQLQDRIIQDTDGLPVERLSVEGRLFQPWREAVQRDAVLPATALADLTARPVRRRFPLPAASTREELTDRNGLLRGVILRSQRRLEAEIELSAEVLADDFARLRCRILNLTRWQAGDEEQREAALLGALVSAHTILTVAGGEFVSLLDPPEPLRQAAAACDNVGTWPVLAGDPGERSTMLSSPIIIYDYPSLAPESAGDLFDGTEIDELLSLRIMTLTDEEKREMWHSDERARRILERTESLAREELMRMHGTMPGSDPATGCVSIPAPAATSSTWHSPAGWPGWTWSRRTSRAGSTSAWCSMTIPGGTWATAASRGTTSSSRPTRSSSWRRSKRPRRSPRPASWSPGWATSSWATTPSASRWRSGWRRGICRPE